MYGFINNTAGTLEIKFEILKVEKEKKSIPL